MNRNERRAEQKLRKRRILWLERERKRDRAIDKIVAQLQEDFDEDELESTKAFVVDCLTDSGPFSQSQDGFDTESMKTICESYDLEPADGIYIVDMLEDIFSAEKQQDGKET